MLSTAFCLVSAQALAQALPKKNGLRPQLSPSLVPPPFPISAFSVPSDAEIFAAREQERWACMRQQGLKIPETLHCAECQPAPDGLPAIDLQSKALIKWLSAHIVQLSQTPAAECILPEVRVSKTQERIDRDSCPKVSQTALEQLSEASGRSLVQQLACLRKLNPDLVRKLDVPVRRLSRPIYSCWDAGDPILRQYWEARCRARLKDSTQASAPASVAACMDVFLKSNRVTIQHPVFPDRWIVRLVPGTGSIVTTGPISARVQFRELFAQAGLGADSTLADGCLGACGPLPGAAYVSTRAGCELCASHSASQERVMRQQQSCSRLGADSFYRSVSEYQSFEECRSSLDQGDRQGLTGGCDRLRKSSFFESVCKRFGGNPVACISDRDARSSLEGALLNSRKLALEFLKGNSDWLERTAY